MQSHLILSVATESPSELQIILATISFYLITGIAFIVFGYFIVAEYLVAKALERKDYKGAAGIILRSPKIISYGSNVLYAANYGDGITLALKADDYELATKLIKKANNQGSYGLIPNVARLFIALKHEKWNDASEIIADINKFFPREKVPADVLQITTTAQAIIDKKDTANGLASLLDVDAVVAEMYRGKPAVAAKIAIGVVIAFGALILTLIVMNIRSAL